MAARAKAPLRRHDGAVGSEADLLERLLHDLRNPLGVVAYFAEAVPEASEAERADLCERLRVNAQRLLHVLEEFGLLSDLRHGRARALVTEWSAADLVTELLDEFEAMDRRPGCVERALADVRPRASRAHVACAWRGLIRTVLRVASGEARVCIALGAEEEQAVLRLAAPLHSDPDIGLRGRLDEQALEIELARRVVRLYGGSLTIDQRRDAAMVSCRLPLR